VEYTTTISLAAPAGRAWSTLANLRRWPDWTPTVESIDTSIDEPVVGQRVAIKQPGRRVAHYTIEEVNVGSRFRWGSHRGGVRQWADHVVTPRGPDACIVQLTFAMTGPVGSLLARLGAGKIRSMVDTEATSLKGYVEEHESPAGY
jgi:hypothetical protein